MSFPLTIEFGTRALEIATEAKVSQACDANRMPGVAHPPYEPCKAVWDTGAMSSVITPVLAQKIGLKSLGLVKMQHANGVSMVNTYMINLLLPNKMEVQTLYVMEGAMTDIDILIGMDIITLCDFAITNKEGKTVFSFDIPSSRKTDYSADSQV